MNDTEVLFQYLKSILYDDHIKKPDFQQLKAENQKLALGLEVLQQQVEEMRHYSADLSQGNLSAKMPSRDNYLCSNLKNLHANLNHLTWQAKQVAQGDYNQEVSYLGEFSLAFNKMTEQLKYREEELKKEAEKTRKKAQMIESYNDLLVEMSRKRNELILVVDRWHDKIIYSNEGIQNDQSGFFSHTQDLPFYHRIVNWEKEDYEIWEARDNGQYYSINSFKIEWCGQESYMHIVYDITKEKLQEDDLTNKAYHDVYGIYNRVFFDEYFQLLLDKQENFVFCYMDLDGLKMVNDHYSHLEGDEYIRSFVSLIKKSFRNNDVFARIGGDEFALILNQCPFPLARQKMKAVYQSFFTLHHKDYPTSFSYGLVEVKGQDHRIMKDILKEADDLMYQCKKDNKKRLKAEIQSW